MKFPDFPRNPHEKRQYFPFVALLAAVSTVVLLLVVYTSNNLRIARQRQEDSLLQEGLTLIRAIEAGDRTGMRMRWDTNNLQVLVEEFAKTPKVAYIRVIGVHESVLALYHDAETNQPSDIDTAWLESNEFKIATATHSSEQQVDVFEITTRVVSRGNPGMGMPFHETDESRQEQSQGSMGRGMMRRMLENSAAFEAIAIIQLGLKMTELQAMRQRDVRSAILMFVVLSVVGSAALYAIVFTQNYHAVNQAFRTIKSYTQHVVDSMANGLISLDTGGNIVTMNRQAHHILGLPEHDAVEGKAVGDIFVCEGFELANVPALGTPLVEREVRCLRANHAILPLSLSASVLTDDAGRHLGTVLLFRDLSEVKALEEQVKRTERLASVGRLAAGVAHEIRNPLGALKGFLQYFQRKLELSEQDMMYVSVMVAEVDRLNSVISNLLEFAHPKEPVLEPCSPAALLKHVLTLVEGDVQARQIEVTCTLPDDVPEIPMDREQLTQVVLNMALNAVQAIEAGGHIRIEADVHAEAKQLEIIIADTGKGIAAEDVARVFDPFFTTRKQGTGLGLAIAHSIVEQHHGEISVESTEGEGTTFFIRLPLQQGRRR